MPETNKDLVAKLRTSIPKRSKFSGIILEAENIVTEIRNKVRQFTTQYQGNPKNYNRNKNRALIGLGTGILSGFLIPGLAVVGLTYGGIKTYQAYKDKKSYKDFPFNRDERGLD